MPRKTVAEWAAQKCGYQGKVTLTPRDQTSCKGKLGDYCEWESDECVVKTGVNPYTGLSFAEELANRANDPKHLRSGHTGGSVKRKKAKRKSKSKLFKTKGEKNNRKTRNNKRSNRRR